MDNVNETFGDYFSGATTADKTVVSESDQQLLGVEDDNEVVQQSQGVDTTKNICFGMVVMFVVFLFFAC